MAGFPGVVYRMYLEPWAAEKPSTALTQKRNLMPLHGWTTTRHPSSMPAPYSSTTHDPEFALGLTPADVDEFRTIIREECGEELSVPDAWARATQVLSLFHYFLRYVAAKQPQDAKLELRPNP